MDTSVKRGDIYYADLSPVVGSDKKRLREKMGHVEENVMEKVDLAIAVSFGLPHDQMV